MGSEQFDVIVVGGGPAGSVTASFVAQAGRRILLLEAARFPRYHIGESLIPGAVQVLRDLGVWGEVDRHGFVQKRGNVYVWGRSHEPWSIAFAEAGIDVYAYQVVRSQFDELLLRYAQRVGVDVRQEHAVREIIVDDCGAARGVRFCDAMGNERSAEAPFVVDASGQACMVGRRLGLRRMDPRLNNVALWSYFRGGDRLPDPQAGYTLSASISDGWLWYIPLHDGTTSVGVVLDVKALRRDGMAIERTYTARIVESELVSRLLARAERIAPLRTIRDWSYRCERFTGPGWLLVGDAAGFVDPILSTGCGMALQASFAASEALARSLDSSADSTKEMEAFGLFYQNYIGQFFDFVHYFYDANRHLDSYFWQARRLVDASRNVTSRNAFIHLIAGLNKAATTPRLRSFEMGVFDNLGSQFGAALLDLRQK